MTNGTKLVATRDCIDPWTFLMINADGSVQPCCWHSPIGTISGEDDIPSLLTGSAITDLRESLLTGKLDDECSRCQSRAETNVASLAARLSVALAS